MSGSTEAMTNWELFVLRHHKPANLALHFVSAVLFFGSPAYALYAWTWRGAAYAFVVFCISGCVGTWAHYVTRDGTVSLRESTSSPSVVGFNVKMWFRILLGRYGKDVANARAKLAARQTELECTVVITGCSSGFGRATVETFLDRGFRVIGTVRRERDIEPLKPLLEKHGAALTFVLADLATAEGRALLIDEVKSRKRLDALVCNAGFGLFGALEDLSEEELRSQVEVNFFATALLTRALVPELRKTKGVLIHVSSPAGVSGFPWTSAYCASKHAVEGLTESLHYELAKTGIRVHLVTPSAHRTEFLKKSRWVIPSGSVHTDGAEAYQAVMEKNQSKVLPPASIVAEAVVNLVEREGYPFRLNVGANVRVLRAMVAWMPESIRHSLVQATFAKATATHTQARKARKVTG